MSLKDETTNEIQRAAAGGEAVRSGLLTKRWRQRIRECWTMNSRAVWGHSWRDVRVTGGIAGEPLGEALQRYVRGR